VDDDKHAIPGFTRQRPLKSLANKKLIPGPAFALILIAPRSIEGVVYSGV
jgi:hypothetical protein